MNEFAGLRPEDFRKAWPNAYQAAVTQIATLQEFNGQQLAAATSQVMWARRAASMTTLELRAARQGVIDEIEAAASKSADTMRAAAETLANESKRLVAKTHTLQAEVDRQRRLLDQSRSEIEVAKRKLKEAFNMEPHRLGHPPPLNESTHSLAEWADYLMDSSTPEPLNCFTVYW